MASGPHQSGGQKGDVASPAADIEDAHAGRNAGFDQELPGDGIYELRLQAEPLSSRSE